LVDASGVKDLQESSYYGKYAVPKMYYKAYYCIGAAIHQKIVRPRSHEDRRNRDPPADVLQRWNQQAKKERQDGLRQGGQGNWRGNDWQQGGGQGGYQQGGQGGYQQGGGQGGDRRGPNQGAPVGGNQ